MIVDLKCGEGYCPNCGEPIGSCLSTHEEHEKNCRYTTTLEKLLKEHFETHPKDGLKSIGINFEKKIIIFLLKKDSETNWIKESYDGIRSSIEYYENNS